MLVIDGHIGDIRKPALPLLGDTLNHWGRYSESRNLLCSVWIVATHYKITVCSHFLSSLSLGRGRLLPLGLGRSLPYEVELVAIRAYGESYQLSLIRYDHILGIDTR